jgi:uncharacterized protein YjbI with pentapeptide repeats
LLLFTDLRSARLIYANLGGADLRGAFIVGANLVGADALPRNLSLDEPCAN